MSVMRRMQSRKYSDVLEKVGSELEDKEHRETVDEILSLAGH